MVSEAFRRMEDKQAEIQAVHDDLIRELSFKLKLDKSTVQRIVYRTCVTTGLPPADLAHIVNEFHIHMKDITHFEEEEE